MNARLLAAVAVAGLAPGVAGCVTTPVSVASSARFVGTVRDNLGQPIARARVTIAGTSVSTGPDGRFRLAAAAADHYGLTIEHPDFAYYSRLLSAPAGERQFRMTRASRRTADPARPISLSDERRPEDCVASPTSPRGEAGCGPGFAIEIPANALVDAQGNRPAGPVEVKLATFEVHTESMPGPFSVAASDTDPTPVAIMTPYGAGMIEIRDPNTGRELNLMPGVGARITIPVHRLAAPTGAAPPPATIPLLRFNRIMQRWVQIDTMTLSEGTYSAEVDHLTDFNADTTFPTWGCLLLQIAGVAPSQITNPPKRVLINLLAFTGVPGWSGSTVVGPPIEFPTNEQGYSITGAPMVVYALRPGLYYFARAFNETTFAQLTDSFSFISYTSVFPQPAQQPQFPGYPAVYAQCTPLTIYWDVSLNRPVRDWGSYVPLAGTVTFDRSIAIVRSPERGPVIERLPRGASLSVLGRLQDRPWLIVRTRRGEVGLAPSEGADLSRAREPAPPAPAPAELRSEDSR